VAYPILGIKALLLCPLNEEFGGYGESGNLFPLSLRVQETKLQPSRFARSTVRQSHGVSKSSIADKILSYFPASNGGASSPATGKRK
jgi:hypothetical protein